ncbi:beta-1,3-galactosyl-O-glycosyl-glycoprotein beta-1,6-N-acetylglucosaminyltransferase 3-like isoform X1 [Lineus longissimus]|uniref:beta-1,3-galactosyl-O-glycosyl-glycoprotein beta-1,6-N-acetylglucosaminyltransferase 3-like isoform X1 n=1 Tax=Lineus longissimus TaxID=88925 RepID=UPI00315CBAC9
MLYITKSNMNTLRFILKHHRILLMINLVLFIFLFWRVKKTGRKSNDHGIFPRNTDFSCPDLWQSGSSGKMAVQRATEFIKTHHRHMISNSQYSDLTKDCATFQKERGYVMGSMTSEEEDYPIAYSIVMYKDVEQVERLLRAIYRPQNVYCIHVDAKTSNETYETVTKIINCFPNVFHAPIRVNVTWGKPSMMMPDLICMAALLKHSTKWRYFINLTGQEFPLKTNGELVRILKALRGANDLEGTLKRRSTHRFRYSYKTKKRKPPPPLQIVPYKGNMHMTASRGFVDFIVNDPKAHTFYKWVEDTRYPEETYFSTLQHNAHLGAPGAYTGNLPETNINSRKPFLSRYMVWLPDTDCQGRFVRQVCVMGVGDLQTLTTRKELFVNKLHLDFQFLALDCLEEWIFQKMREEYATGRKLDTTYYEGLEFVRNCNCNITDK